MDKKTKFKDARQDAARRLKVARGHLDKVIAMVEEGVYCVDVIQQTAAVRGAIKKAEELLLLNHLNHCVADAFHAPKRGNQAIEELSRVFKKIA